MRELIKAAAALAVIWAGTHYMVKRAIGAEIALVQESVERGAVDCPPVEFNGLHWQSEPLVAPGPMN